MSQIKDSIILGSVTTYFFNFLFFRLSYGKAPRGREVGIELSTYEFQHTKNEKLNFFTFGAGEDKVVVDEVRVVKGRPIVKCSGGLIKVCGEGMGVRVCVCSHSYFHRWFFRFRVGEKN